MKVLLIDNGTKHIRSLKKLLLKDTIETVRLFDDYSNPNNFDLVILSGGSKFSVVKYPDKFSEEIELIKNSKTPIVGICEGCEIIAYAYGSKLERLKEKTKGVKGISLIKKTFLFTVPENFKVYEAHRWAITKLGNELVGLAQSKDGFEIIKHNTRQIYGFQFHPEMFVEKTLGGGIFQSLIKNIYR